jgi:hypothetical protein
MRRAWVSIHDATTEVHTNTIHGMPHSEHVEDECPELWAVWYQDGSVTYHVGFSSAKKYYTHTSNAMLLIPPRVW